MNPRRRLASTAILLLIATPIVAGTLDPPGPPSPTMKTLDEIEPAIPIHAASFPFTIVQGGSYYVADDVTAASGGITIYASNVTLDLRGHSLAGSTGSGIYVNPGVANVEIRNGRLSGWAYRGIDAASADHVRVVEVRVNGTATGTGILLGPHGVVERSAAFGNGNVGIQVIGAGGVVLDSVANGNASHGIKVDTAGVIRGCTANGNGGEGIVGYQGTVIESCTASSNTLRGIVGTGAEIVRSAAYQNQVDGIDAYGAVVRDCSVEANVLYGILTTGNSLVVGNVARGNQNAGIFVTGSGSRIDGNTSLDNVNYGVYCGGTGNTIVRNLVRGGVIKYQIGAGNEAGPVGGASSATSPWANLQN